jgi:recombination protein RecA
MRVNKPLSQSLIELILGSLLGDGCITLNKGYANARFSFRHSQKQKEYFDWKVSMLKEISSKKNVWLQDTKDNEYCKSNSVKYRFQSLALPELTNIYNLVVERGKKRINQEWLNLLTPLSLATWWMDDGSIISNCRKGVFCTDAFLKKEVIFIQKYLKSAWDIDTKIGETSKSNSQKRRYFRLYIQSTEELKKFFRIIAPYIQIKSMMYKILILYKDNNLQERWISEMVKLTNFGREDIEKVIFQRKSSLKMFNIQKKI